MRNCIFNWNLGSDLAMQQDILHPDGLTTHLALWFWYYPFRTATQGLVIDVCEDHIPKERYIQTGLELETTIRLIKLIALSEAAQRPSRGYF